MKIGKAKYWIIAGIVGVTGATAYWVYGQYKKLMKNVTGFKSMKLDVLTLDRIKMNILVTYKNTMDIDVVLSDQKYDIYLDNYYATTLTNPNTITLKANDTTEIPLDLDFNPAQVFKQLNIGPARLLTDYKNIRVKLVMRVKWKVLFFNIPISYTYEDKLKNFLGLK
jgi:LEA14-like dessication related protein